VFNKKTHQTYFQIHLTQRKKMFFFPHRGGAQDFFETRSPRASAKAAAFPKSWGIPKRALDGLFPWENPRKIDDFGVHPF